MWIQPDFPRRPAIGERWGKISDEQKLSFCSGGYLVTLKVLLQVTELPEASVATTFMV